MPKKNVTKPLDVVDTVEEKVAANEGGAVKYSKYGYNKATKQIFVWNDHIEKVASRDVVRLTEEEVEKKLKK